ncbi:nucleolar MIF4G domain-containing protein 1 [Trichinella spiralis]|uniref:nucleolar MIF4G domain-containing protein 1 n=1 Tax=Trichinella spiralis TaxID=6334 RepID=UPI0001EFC262|nr:nucleolar MIF4G domain-containing protein 1 [Trichinella spiralis]
MEFGSKADRLHVHVHRLRIFGERSARVCNSFGPEASPVDFPSQHLAHLLDTAVGRDRRPSVRTLHGNDECRLDRQSLCGAGGPDSLQSTSDAGKIFHHTDTVLRDVGRLFVGVVVESVVELDSTVRLVQFGKLPPPSDRIVAFHKQLDRHLLLLAFGDNFLVAGGDPLPRPPVQGTQPLVGVVHHHRSVEARSPTRAVRFSRFSALPVRPRSVGTAGYRSVLVQLRPVEKRTVGFDNTAQRLSHRAIFHSIPICTLLPNYHFLELCCDTSSTGIDGTLQNTLPYLIPNLTTRINYNFFPTCANEKNKQPTFETWINLFIFLTTKKSNLYCHQKSHAFLSPKINK